MKIPNFHGIFICCCGRIISSPTTPPSRRGKAPIVPCLLFSALHYGTYLSFSPKTLRIFGVPCLSATPDKWRHGCNPFLHGLCFFYFLSKQYVRYKHYAKADKQGVCRSALCSVRVRFRYHFIAYDVQHCTARKCKRKRKYRL